MFFITNFIFLLFVSTSFGAIRRSFRYKWPKTGIRVNYYYNSWYLDKAIANLEENTCLRFKREYDYYGIKDDNGLEFIWTEYCYVDHVGKKINNESNKIYVSKECMYDITKIEALMLQALGLLTEYSRRDRNNYIKINKDNINPKYERYFYLNGISNASTYKTPYDYGSILHDDSKAFSKNNQDTLEVKNEHKEFYQKMIGQRYRTGFYDYKLINEHYCSDECKDKGKKPECWWNGYQNPNKCNECLCPYPLTGSICRGILPNSSPSINNYYKIDERGRRFNLYDQIDVHIFLETDHPKKLRFTWEKMNLYNYTPCGPKSDAAEVKYKADKGLTGLCFCGYINEPYSIDSEDKLLIFIYHGSYLFNHITFFVKPFHNFLNKQAKV